VPLDQVSIRICHLDDEPWILSFIPRRLHLEIIRNADPDATLEELGFADGDILPFNINFKCANISYKVEYLFFTNAESFLSAENGFRKPVDDVRERNVVAIFDLRIGDIENAGRACFDEIRERLQPHTNIDWLFLTAYPGSIGLDDRESKDRIFAKPPNRNDLFARIYSSVRKLLDEAPVS
jgi:hypothetical protein